MAKQVDFVKVFKLLNELEKSAERIHKISADFQNRVKQQTSQQAA